MASVHKLFETAIHEEQAGDLAAAAGRYREVLRRRPRHRKALVNLAGVLKAQGQAEQSVACYRKALPLHPRCARTRTNLAAALHDLGRLEEAAAWCREALFLEPDYAPAHNNLGVALATLGRPEEAARSFRRAVGLAPRFPQAHNNLGNALIADGAFEEAVESFRRALHLRPDYADAHDNLGAALQALGRFEDAALSHRRALARQPVRVSAHSNLGNAFRALGAFDEAMASYERALQLNPHFADAHWNRALAELMQGDFEHGWAGYEWRFRAGGARVPPCPQPRWNGGPLEGRTVLVQSEQGVGDEIMFASCLPDLTLLAGRSIVTADPRLVPLFRRSFPEATVLARPEEDGALSEQAGAVDLWVPAGSLPRFLRPSLASFPERMAYLVPDPVEKRRWQDRLAALGSGLKIGLSWRGGKPGKDRRLRSTSLVRWASLVARRGATFLSLQYDLGAGELESLSAAAGVSVAPLDGLDPRANLDGLAAAMAALDLVIAVDSATVHLAGALGVPVWTLLPFAADWRWMTKREDSPWYPTMKLFRQPRPGDWDPVFGAVGRDLERRIGKSD